MNRLSKAQKTKVATFQTVTGASDSVAIECLKAVGWTVEGAIDTFYTSGVVLAEPQPRVDRAALEAFFDKYKDEDQPSAILADGIEQLCVDLEVDPADIVMLVLSWRLNAATMCVFSRDEFMKGMEALRVDSLAALQAKLPALRAELSNAATFREVYNFAYSFSREPGTKCVQLDTALAMWQLLLAERWPLLGRWTAFLTEHHASRAISRDTWTQLWDFINFIGDDLSKYDETAAWPYLLDDFVEHMRRDASAQQAQ